MLVTRHHELDITEEAVVGAMDIHDCDKETAVAILIGDPSDEERAHFHAKYPSVEYSNPKKADRMIRTTRIALARWRGKVILGSPPAVIAA